MKRSQVVLRVVLPGALSVALLTGCSVLGGGPPKTSVDVDLTEWGVKPSVAEVSSGRTKFVAHNKSTTMIHELAIVSVGADGQKHEVADVEDVKPNENGEFVADLKPGNYELACLIAPGEAGSNVDHYQMGMHIAFVVR